MTMQALERIIHDGAMFEMEPTPNIPEIPGLIEKVGWEDAKDCDSIIFSTACWRKYLGTWEIKDSRLFLLAVQGIYSMKTDEPIFASWFTGTLQIYQGRRLYHLEKTFERVFEFELIVSVESGLIKHIQQTDNRNREPNPKAFDTQKRH